MITTTRNRSDIHRVIPEGNIGQIGHVSRQITNGIGVVVSQLTRITAAPTRTKRKGLTTNKLFPTKLCTIIKSVPSDFSVCEKGAVMFRTGRYRRDKKSVFKRDPN
jgi:hypothetical protein